MFFEIWSDVVCPFCYIGKRNFEGALKDFPEPIQVVWRSFELQPDAPKSSSLSNIERLAQKYQKPLEWAKQMTDQVTAKAEAVGLTLHLDKVIPTNSFDAHRLIHLAETKQKQNEMKEHLLEAYFTSGQNISDHEVLITLAQTIGLDRNEVHTMLNSDRFQEEVRHDERLARDLEIAGVPFFVVNQRYAISGAQSKEYFLESLLKIQSTDENPQI